ncbi:MAG TPA: RNA-binding transcriptional accessory protein, partial [Bacteroidetes bacterium]|nr:RNA-binding transcriptional accessory protein [Bacteroidota bacterium]
MQEEDLYTLIAEELGLRWIQVKNTVELLDEGNTVPFIARYRKERTGSLDEEEIRAIEDRIRYLRSLEERKAAVLRSIEEQGKLTPELAEKIKAATKLQEVEDLYLPFRPKRRTRATIAKERGLEPLAQLILEQKIEEGDPLELAQPFVDPEKDVPDAETALAGARDIVAEVVSDDAEVRKIAREMTTAEGVLTSEAKNPDALGVYEMYAEYSEPVRHVPPHRILAINRGEREGYLRVHVEAPEGKIVAAIEERYVTNPRSVFTEHLRSAIADGYNRLVAPAIEREIRNALTDRAEEHAIQVFARNLRALLLTPPVRGKVIMG